MPIVRMSLNLKRVLMPIRVVSPIRLLLMVLTCLTAVPVGAQERAYFVTYDHYLEERGDLELEVAATSGVPKGDDRSYTAPWLEIEYGVRGWWTTELYLEAVAARGDGSALTGWRWEHRLKPLKSEHALNPVLYVEYEHVNEASRIQKEVVGAGRLPFEPIDELREEYAHELETKLILSSTVRGWNLSENVTFEKNLSEDEGIEFGYSAGVSRALGGLASGTACRFCRENFVLGAEVYGGLGSSAERTLRQTRHYVAPVLAWHIGERSTLKASAAFGLSPASDRILVRIAYAYELPLGGE